jgi:polar amino acid transport system ATP-binding protein
MTITTEQPLVKIEGLHKYYGTHHVLRGIDLTVNQGEVSVVIGPSGSGKSTMLRCVNLLETISAGRISVGGELIGYREVKGRLHDLKTKEIAAQRREIGMVFQRFNLFPHKTALQNIMEAPVQVKGQSKAVARTTPPSSQAASSSASRLPGPWPWTPSSCCSMSPRPRSTLSSWAMS